MRHFLFLAFFLGAAFVTVGGFDAQANTSCNPKYQSCR